MNFFTTAVLVACVILVALALHELFSVRARKGSMTFGAMGSTRSIIYMNDTTVYANMPVKAVSGDIVTFTDGSTVNMQTKDIHLSSEEAQISFEPSEVEGEFTVVGPTTYDAQSVFVDGLSADIKINPTHGDKMILEMRGPSTLIEGISAEVRGDELVITQERSSGIHVSSTVIELQFGSVSVHMGNGAVAEVVLHVPVRTPLKLHNMHGDVVVGDTHGPLDLRLTGHGDANIGIVAESTLVTRSLGEVDVRHVQGSLVMESTGHGDISVRSGECASLSMHTTLLGVLSFGGVAASADLQTSGHGDLFAHQVDGKLSIRSTSLGEVNVARGSVTELHIVCSGHGDATFGGHAQKAWMRTSGLGSIDVYEVDHIMERQENFHGDITVRNRK